MVRVLVVDDSSFVRHTLSALLARDPLIEVAGLAANGKQAVEMARNLDPDVITLDVEMPGMDGLTALKLIMKESPCPVIMISSLTREGADITLKALELGALDFVPKLGSNDPRGLEKELHAKVKALARRKAFLRLVHRHGKKPDGKTEASAVSGAKPGPHAAPAGTSPGVPGLRRTQKALPDRRIYDIVAIGVSTGGPPAVQKILSALPGDFLTPILIAQHMPASFTGPFAKRLDSQCDLTIKEAEHLEVLRSATAYICPGGKHIRLEKNRAGLLMAAVDEEPRESLYKPSVNVLMESVGLTLGRRGLGITLTGMGNDGLTGTRILKEKGGWSIAQNEASCVVYGMPKAVIDAGLADEIVDIDDMADAILSHFAK